MALALIVGLILLGASGGLLARAAGLSRVRSLQRVEAIGGYGLPSSELAADQPRRGRGGSLLGYVACRVGEAVAGRASRIDLDKARRQLLRAGFYRIRPEAFVGWRVLGAAAMALLWVLSAGPTAGGLAIAGVLAVACWFLPGYLLGRHGGRRLERIEDALPALVDLLVVTVEAGLSFSSSLKMATQHIGGPLGNELRLALQEQRMGLPIGEALENMLQRCDTPPMRSFVRSITQGETLGVSIGSIMRGLAVEMRQRRKARAEERAHKAPVKMLFPLVFLIFPSLFVVILGPAVMDVMKAFGSI